MLRLFNLSIQQIIRILTRKLLEIRWGFNRDSNVAFLHVIVYANIFFLQA
jgi:hypothetical protein